MRHLTELEVNQLIALRKAGGLTDEGEALYQRVVKGDLRYDGYYGGDEE